MLVTESMTVVRAIVAVLKMVMLKAMERGIMSKAAGRTCCLTEIRVELLVCAHARSCELRAGSGAPLSCLMIDTSARVEL